MYIQTSMGCGALMKKYTVSSSTAGGKHSIKSACPVFTVLLEKLKHVFLKKIKKSPTTYSTCDHLHIYKRKRQEKNK